MKFKKILRAVKSVVLSMAHMDYQMEFKKRKKPNADCVGGASPPSPKGRAEREQKIKEK